MRRRPLFSELSAHRHPMTDLRAEWIICAPCYNQFLCLDRFRLKPSRPSHTRTQKEAPGVKMFRCFRIFQIDHDTKVNRTISVLAMLTLSPCFFPTGGSTEEGPRWVDTKQQADWPGNDYGCSPGSEPIDTYCDANRIGDVAVCWIERNTGYPPFKECLGYRAWCTYKCCYGFFGPPS